MKYVSLKRLLLTLAALGAAVYLLGVIMIATRDSTVPVFDGAAPSATDVAIFGASGTAGDGILKAVIADPDVASITVFTRRTTPRMQQAVARDQIRLVQHMDYLDYGAVQDDLTDIDTVYWAIGISSLGVDEDTYRRIHSEFPLQFLRTWVAANPDDDLLFQFISSSDISEDSDTMWIREKIRAEQLLAGFAQGQRLRVIAHRPDYIGPTQEEAHLGQRLLYGFFRPVGAAVKATEIGRAMLELTTRQSTLSNGDTVNTGAIIAYSRAYDARHQTPDKPTR